MDNNIVICRKPNWVTWDDIKQCIVDAHSINKSKGINMTHYQMPAEKIKDYLGESGVILVALDGKTVVGTAAITEKIGKMWYTQGHYAYVCFDGVIPNYSGKGIFRLLDIEREKVALQLGLNVLVFDTHQMNITRQSIALKNGYKYVRFFEAISKDHYSVVMAKWLDGCPYSSFYCWRKYQLSKVKTILRTKLLHR